MNNRMKKPRNNKYPSTATKHRLLGRRRRKEAFSVTDSDRALNCKPEQISDNSNPPT